MPLVCPVRVEIYTLQCKINIVSGAVGKQYSVGIRIFGLSEMTKISGLSMGRKPITGDSCQRIFADLANFVGQGVGDNVKRASA